MKKAVFLDRDGTINSDEHGYINKPKDLILYPFAAKAISLLNELDYYVFVVTNQAGVAYGYFKIEDVDKINSKMLADLGTARIDEVYFSPYHKHASVKEYKCDHEDRKPGIGMFKKAHEKYQIDVKSSFMIGDKMSDIEFGLNAGLTTILVLTGDGKDQFENHRKSWKIEPDFVVEDLLAASILISKLGR